MQLDDDILPCPCGTARRAFQDVPGFPATIHVTSITADARLHYHKRLTETYYFLECGPEAQMQLDDDILPVKPGICIVIPPGVRIREWLGEGGRDFDIALIVRTIIEPPDFAARANPRTDRSREESGVWKKLFARL